MATGTLVDVVMPQMGVSVSEGTITRWAKAVGETIEADETIVEISTDKVDTEVPSPASGVVRELFAEEGDTVPVNTRIAVIDTGGGGGGGGDDAPAETPQETTAEPEAAAPEPAAEASPAPAASAPSAPQAETAEGNGHNGDGRTFVSPVVARMVSDHGLDINALTGTGGGGRGRKKDVQGFIDSGGGAAPADAPEVHDVPHFAPPEAPDTAEPAPAAPTPAAAPATPPPPKVGVAAGGEAGPGEELYRFNTIRKVIARHMRHSLETAAQVTTVIEVDMTGIVNLRRRWKPVYQERYGVNLTYVPFIARAVIDAIGHWPWVNA